MIQELREYSKNIFFKLLLGVIAITFVLSFGVGGFFGDRKEVVAKVNDQEILLKEYREAYQIRMRAFQEQFGENAEKFAEQLNLRQQVFNQLIDRYLLLTDAAEGCLPGTSFVMKKALAQGLRPIVIINKIDRKDARPKEVIDEVFDLFVALGATDEQLDFPILYASGRDGWSVKELSQPKENLHSLLDLMLQHVPAPKVEIDKPFAMLSTLLYADSFLGRCLVGRVGQGTARINQSVKAINLNGEKVDAGRLTKLLRFEGTKKIPVEEVVAGDIVIIAGLTKATVADTICDLSVDKPLPSTPIDPPTMSISISVNSSPLAGKDGVKLTSTKIRERLLAEDENNVGITFSENENKDYFEISGRGELQLGVLVETMRREGFELTVSRPRVIFKTDANGNKTEPMEEVTIDLDAEFSSKIIDNMNKRKAEMINMIDTGAG